LKKLKEQLEGARSIARHAAVHTHIRINASGKNMPTGMDMKRRMNCIQETVSVPFRTTSIVQNALFIASS